MLPSMPTYHINAFFTWINLRKFGEKEIKIDKIIQPWLKVATSIEYKKYMVSTNVE